MVLLSTNNICFGYYNKKNNFQIHTLKFNMKRNYYVTCKETGLNMNSVISDSSMCLFLC